MDQYAECLYCEETKPLDAFNREHVMPVAFGKFVDNFVLRGCVCGDCNSYFDKELDIALARDSMEGLDRFVHGIVEPKRDRKLQTRLVVKVHGGPFDGAPLQWELDETGTQLRAAVPPQIGIGPGENGPFEWYRPEDVPPVETLQTRGGFYCVVGGMSATDAAEFLRRRGIDSSPPVQLPDPRDADGTIGTTMEGVIGLRLRRAIAKIAFNYFAYHYRWIAGMTQYRAIRRYIRFGEEPQFNPVSIEQRPIIANLPANVRLVAHAATVRWREDLHKTIAQVSLFDYVQYRITFSTDRFLVPPSVVDSGHAFNPATRQIIPLTRDRRLAAKNPPLMTRDEFDAWQKTEMEKPGESTRTRKARKGSRSRPKP